jgi:hypothetical protein
MQTFSTYILQLQLPPNPIRNLDGSLTASQAAGAAFFAGPPSDVFMKNCEQCHTLDPSIGAFGTSGLTSFSLESQHFKVPHLRNAYQKVGMFGSNAMSRGSPTTEQVRGFGYLNDGSIDTVVTFLSKQPFFMFPGGDSQRADVANFIMAFPSNLAPVVGQQVTLQSDWATHADVVARLDLLVARAGTPYANVDRSPNNECDLVVKGKIGGVPRGWWMSAPGVFSSDASGEPAIADADLRNLASAAGQELTYTCAPPGSGPRMGIDRGGVGDGSQPDGILDSEQCGDVTADGVATGADVAALRQMFASLSTPAAPGKCNVAGNPGRDAASCDIVDLAVLRRAIAGLAPALSAGCNED